MITPNICTSLRCSPPHSHCRDCSHAIFHGEVISNGRTHRFEFSPQFGVTFLTVTGTHRQVQPAEDNQVWEKFEEWRQDKFEVNTNGKKNCEICEEGRKHELCRKAEREEGCLIK